MTFDSDDDVVYRIRCTWIDHAPRETRIRESALNATPKWLSPEQPPPIDICQAIRLAQAAVLEHTSVPPSDYSRARVALETVEPDHCFWCITFLLNKRTYYTSLEIGVLMNGEVVMPEPV